MKTGERHYHRFVTHQYRRKESIRLWGIKDSALKISGSVLKKMVEKEQQKKPGCMGFLHQPKRPAALKKTK